jgi:hypothetical protein
LIAKRATDAVRSGRAILDDVQASRSGAGFADDAIAALADAAGAATAHAGLLNDRRGAIVVHRKAFSELHGNTLCFCAIMKAERTLSMAR